MAEERQQPKELLRTFRLPFDEWQRFDEVAKSVGTDRSKELVNFVRWYIGDPRGKRPTRPLIRKRPTRPLIRKRADES